MPLSAEAGADGPAPAGKPPASAAGPYGGLRCCVFDGIVRAAAVARLAALTCGRLENHATVGSIAFVGYRAGALRGNCIAPGC